MTLRQFWVTISDHTAVELAVQLLLFSGPLFGGPFSMMDDTNFLQEIYTLFLLCYPARNDAKKRP